MFAYSFSIPITVYYTVDTFYRLPWELACQDCQPRLLFVCRFRLLAVCKSSISAGVETQISGFG